MPAISTDTALSHLLLEQGSGRTTEISSIRSQVVVTQYQDKHIAFPSLWIDEVMFFPRRQVFKLPFYPAELLGIVKHQGQLVPLVQYQSNSTPTARNQQENIRAIRLGARAGKWAGVAVVIDKILETVEQDELKHQSLIQLFSPDHIPSKAFQPCRWM